jgi:hypothetical protein
LELALTVNVSCSLDLYYRDYVIGGTGAFPEIAANVNDFARKVHRKFELKVGGLQPQPVL